MATFRIVADGIRYVRRKITLPPDPRAVFSSNSSCDLSPETYEMIVGEGTGLGYVSEFVPPGHEGEYYTIVHLPSGRFLSLGWSVESEELAILWIERLVKLADWTRFSPQMRSEAAFDVFKLACIGLLSDGRSLSGSSGEGGQL